MRSNQWKHRQQNGRETDEICGKRHWEVDLELSAGLSLCRAALTVLHSLSKGVGGKARPKACAWTYLSEPVWAFVIRICSRDCRREERVQTHIPQSAKVQLNGLSAFAVPYISIDSS